MKGMVEIGLSANTKVICLTCIEKPELGWEQN